MRCASCDSPLSDEMRHCFNCGREALPAAGVRPDLAASRLPSRPRARSGAEKVGNVLGMSFRRFLKLPKWAILITVLILAALVEREILKSKDVPSRPDADNKEAIEPIRTNIPERSAERKAFELTPADKFALQLQHTFEANGYDITIFVIDRALTAKSDLFKNAYSRESEANELAHDPKALCDLDIWYVKVGYSKGMFSGDIMKTINVGCPAEKIARIQEMAPEREKAASDLSVEGMHATTMNTTLIFESDFFSDPALRSKFIRSVVKNGDHMRRLCNLEFTKVELRFQGRTVQTVSLSCK